MLPVAVCRHTRGILIVVMLAAAAFGGLSLLHAASSPSADGIGVHRTILIAHLLFGGLLAMLAAAGAVWSRSWPARILLVLVGVGIVWGAMLAGIGAGYRAWQAMPDAPDEAFADGGPMMFGLFLGWVPGVATMAIGIAGMVALRWIAGRLGRDDDSSSRRPAEPVGSSG